MSFDFQRDGVSRGAMFGEGGGEREQSLSFGEPAASMEGSLGSPWATAPLR